MNQCQKCRGCCKFKKEDAYFSTLFTKEEIGKIKSKGFYKNIFNPYKNSTTVYQIQLIESKKSKKVLVCPYLDENTHLCNIYKIRPFDCRFWPLLFMFDKKKEKILLAHFNKEVCQITDRMDKIEFDNDLNKNYYKAINFARKYPEFIWDFEPYTFIIKEIKPTVHLRGGHWLV